MILSRYFVLLSIVCCSLVGCGEERVLPDRNVITGNVTLDGKSLDTGTISFSSPEDIARGLPTSADIKDGKYQLHVTPGKKRVRVTTFIVDQPETIPEKYNKKSKLEAVVGGDNTEFNFDLKTK